MPAASIVNGCTGSLRPATSSDFEGWRALIALGADLRTDTQAIASATIGRHLHCAEFWMPGGCNLRCRHCYVATHSDRIEPVLSADQYYSLTLKLIAQGFVDVVVPGMEPLLREELWSVLDAAADGKARSAGITTNATLLARHSARLHDSALSVLNVSLDGPPAVHDRIRGVGVFRRFEEGVRTFRKISTKRLITNTTVHRENAHELRTIARIGYDLGVNYSAFHPFEGADEAENSLAISTSAIVTSYLDLLEAFRSGQVGSLVLEAEASTFGVIVGLLESGSLDQTQLVVDEAGFVFLREVRGDHELLVSLMFYPHHFVRTVRVADDGGLSSCRAMARGGWRGVGDLRHESAQAALTSPEAVAALASIWDEFRAAQIALHPGAVERLCEFLLARTDSGLAIA